MRLMLAALGILAASTFALAQNPPADQQPPADSGQSAPPPAATQPPQPDATQPSQQPQQRRNARPAQQQGAQVTRPKTMSDCRNMARSQNLQGDSLRFYMQGCRREVAVPCRQQAQAQGLQQGEAMRNFMRSCMGMAARRQPGTAGSGQRSAAPPAGAGGGGEDQNDQPPQ